jgi:CubicO group peptidase (beta-lactamase class C family)
MIDTASAQDQLQDLLNEQVEQSSVPGFVAGIWWDGDAFEAASGIANLNTGAPMTPDTAFLLGSISKVAVTSMLMRFVERGAVRLDDRVIDHLPELRLGNQTTLETLQVRHLVNHSSGIDAADFAPDFGRGTDAIRRYVAALGDIGQVYPIGQHISYCNPGFIIAGRMLEVITGDDFDSILKREIFTPFDLSRSSTSGDEAILHRTAIGHIVDPETDIPRATRRFMLPYSMAPAGSTIITTIDDLLRFARVHLAGGLTPGGDRVLGYESVAAMATETIREEAMAGFGVGLGWLLPPFRPMQVLMHTGGSYGGLSSLIVVPERQFACAAFGNSTSAATIHQQLHDFALQEMLGLPVPEPLEPVATGIEPSHYTGTFHKQYTRTAITEGEDGGLTATVTLEYDDSQRELFREYSGRDEYPPFPLHPVTPSFFVPGGPPTDSIPLSRMPTAGLTFLDPDDRGRFQYMSSGLRISRRVLPSPIG